MTSCFDPTILLNVGPPSTSLEQVNLSCMRAEHKWVSMNKEKGISMGKKSRSNRMDN